MTGVKVVTMILAGGAGKRLLPLTRNRCKPAVSFAGSLRVIDFTLFNCAASDLHPVHVLTQYQAKSLHRHLGARWTGISGLRSDFVKTLYSKSTQHGGRGEYVGTADAVYKNLEVLERYKPDVVLVLSGDHVYRADYRPFIEAHLDGRAEVSILTGEVASAEASAFGVLKTSSDGRVLEFVEKPRDPRPYARDGRCQINLGIYGFAPRFLVNRLLVDALDAESSHDFGKDVLPGAPSHGRVLSFPLALASPDAVHPDPVPYWRDVGTIESYFEAQMDLLLSRPPFRLEDPRWPPESSFHGWIPRRSRGEATSWEDCVPGQSLIDRHAQVDGARLANCIVSSGVRIEAGAELEECVLLPGCRIGRGASLHRVIVDEEVRVPSGACLGARNESNGLPRRGIDVFSGGSWEPLCSRAANDRGPGFETPALVLGSH